MASDADMLLSQPMLARIWQAHGLGSVDHIERPGYGSVNAIAVVNSRHVIRIDLLNRLSTNGRYAGEALAYDHLRAAALPAPEVVAIDLSRQVIPNEYMVMSRLDGAPLVQLWSALSDNQQAAAADTFGRYLARMHRMTFTTCESLKHTASSSGFALWYDYIFARAVRHAKAAQDSGALSPMTAQRWMWAFARRRSLFDTVTVPRLVHSDLQFENVLAHDGYITGLIDFEWAVSGDPTFEFVVDYKWEAQCPGSMARIYAAYQQERPLEPHHGEKLVLYKLLWDIDLLDDLSERQNSPGWQALQHTVISAIDRLYAGDPVLDYFHPYQI